MTERPYKANLPTNGFIGCSGGRHGYLCALWCPGAAAVADVTSQEGRSESRPVATRQVEPALWIRSGFVSSTGEGKPPT